MDPLYANLDKRNSSVDQPKTPAPQPSVNSMPNFGQPSAPVTPTQTPAPAQPIVSSPKPVTPAQPIVSAPTEPIISTPTQPAAQAPTVSGSGDIILNIDQPKKNKKKVISLVSILIVVIFGIGFGSWFLLRNTLQNEFILEFNTYANKLLYGEDSKNDIKDFKGVHYVYHFDNQNMALAYEEDDIENIKKFYSDVSEKILDFNSDAIANNKLSDETKEEISQYTEDALSFFEISQLYFLDSDIIYSYYLANGYKETQDLINEYYSYLTNSQHQKTINVGESLILAATYYLDKITAYEKAGCVKESSIDPSCSMIDIPFQSDIRIKEIEASIENNMNNLREKVLKGCWSIHEKIV